MANPTNRVNSYERTKSIDSGDIDIINAVEKSSIEDTAAGRQSKGILIDTDQVMRSDDLDFEVFMRDILEVFVAEPNNENDPQFVELNVNGDYKLVVRGDTVQMRRYHVAVLAQAKQSRVSQRKIVNNDGSIGYIEENKLSLVYPFQVQMDPNLKRGAPWLKQMLSNPA